MLLQQLSGQDVDKQGIVNALRGMDIASRSSLEVFDSLCCCSS